MSDVVAGTGSTPAVIEPPTVPQPEPHDWVGELSTAGSERDAALRDLHALLVRGARHQVSRMRGQLPGVGAVVREDIAQSAADQALAVLLTKLHTFEGRSRFTTWAYKFAILTAATEVRRQVWAHREVPLEDAVGPDFATSGVGSADPVALIAEADELAGAVSRALDVALTAYQRRGAPGGRGADRRPGRTARHDPGALYKTLHVARTRLRAYLTAQGYLSPTTGTSEPRSAR
jgi:RNA polymerase sigma-70 factor (ECF subfamily)